MKWRRLVFFLLLLLFFFYLFLFHSGPMNRLVGCCRSKRSAWWGVSAGFAFQKLLPIGRWGPSIATNQDMLGRQLVFLKWGKSKLAPHVRNLIDSIAVSHLQFFTKTSFCLLPNAEELPKTLPPSRFPSFALQGHSNFSLWAEFQAVRQEP